MAIQGDAELGAQQFLLDGAAHRLALDLHGRIRRAPIPGQAGADALPAEQKRHPSQRVHRRVAHQVHAIGVAAHAARHAAGVDQRHEDEADLLQLTVQHAVPAQAGHQTAEIGQQDMGADALEAVNAAEEADRGRAGIPAAQTQGIDGESVRAGFDPAQAAHPQMRRPFLDDAFEFDQFIQHGVVTHWSATRRRARA